jgi:fermentation-respiration switch protein FrsA (DUF1100 family)
MATEREVHFGSGDRRLTATLGMPDAARALIVFAHGSGSGRRSPRNRFVASKLNEAGIATLLLDLLTENEERLDDRTASLRFDIALLARRITAVTDWTRDQKEFARLPIGYFGEHGRGRGTSGRFQTERHLCDRLARRTTRSRRRCIAHCRGAYVADRRRAGSGRAGPESQGGLAAAPMRA